MNDTLVSKRSLIEVTGWILKQPIMWFAVYWRGRLSWIQNHCLYNLYHTLVKDNGRDAQDWTDRCHEHGVPTWRMFCLTSWCEETIVNNSGTLKKEEKYPPLEIASFVGLFIGQLFKWVFMGIARFVAAFCTPWNLDKSITMIELYVAYWRYKKAKFGPMEKTHDATMDKIGSLEVKVCESMEKARRYKIAKWRIELFHPDTVEDE